MSNIEHGRTVVIIYFCLLVLMAIINIIGSFNILSVIYLITLVGSVFKYLLISKE